VTERTDYDQLRELMETLTEADNQAMGQVDEMMAMVQRMVDDGQDEWRQTVIRKLDHALELDDAGLRRGLI
jgi:hypothetical protein